MRHHRDKQQTLAGVSVVVMVAFAILPYPDPQSQEMRKANLEQFVVRVSRWVVCENTKWLEPDANPKRISHARHHQRRTTRSVVPASMNLE